MGQVMDECRYCYAEAVVPVLDKRLHNSPTAGNPFRSRCMGCERWLPMTGKDAFKEHPDSMVLPADQDPDDPDLVLFTEYDYQDELDQLAKKVERGGTDNEFRCPADGCEADHTGYPDECGECGVPYDW